VSESRRGDAARIEVPAADAPVFRDINGFALTYNGYDRHGGFDEVASIGNGMRAQWSQNVELSDDLGELRCSLFFEQRRYRHRDCAPEGAELDYIRALVEAIRDATGGSVPGHPDDAP
jgi:hypothetical protein